jgi:hypothetical protein
VTILLGAGALLLLTAGAVKVADPTRTAGALAAVGWPSSPRLVRAGAGAEALIGAGALIVGGPVFAGLVGLSYLAFAGFVVVALRAGTPVGSCGCFGRADTPPHVLHVAVDLALAAGALAAAVASAGPLFAAGAVELAAGAALAAVAAVALTRPSQSLKITT